MEKEYLSIRQASEKYKMSSSTLTRFARSNENTNFVKKEKGRFLILDSLLSSNFEKVEKEILITDNRHDEPNQKTEIKENDNILMVSQLQKENEFLRMEIGNKNKTIDTLLQRQLESNTIIQTLQNRFESIGTKIDNSVLLLSEKVKENRPVTSTIKEKDTSNFGYTVASSVMIILLVLAIIIFLTIK